ncbi:MAG: methyl-accepting chemotaxis protein [Thermodesulfobacteriota bacterium]|nr:methyl-accepting chemotaxis protein [Thermodesulfobacteriota bacterium]
MGVKAKISIIVGLGVLAGLLLSVFNTISMGRQNKGFLAVYRIDQAVRKVLSVRVAEKEFLYQGREESWKRIEADLKATGEGLGKAREQAPALGDKVEALQATVKKYGTGLAGLRSVVLGIKSGLSDFSRQGHGIEDLLQKELLTPLKGELSMARMLGSEVSPLKQTCVNNSAQVLDLLVRAKLNLVELFLFFDLDFYNRQKEEIGKELKRTRRNLLLSYQAVKDEKLYQTVQNFDRLLEELLALESRLVSLLRQRNSLEGDFEHIGQSMVAGSRSLLEEMRDVMELQAKTNRSVNWVIVAVVALALVVLGVSIGRSVTNPLESIMAFARDVADGHLEAQAKGSFSGEMARLNRDIENMVVELKEKMAEAETKSLEAVKEAEVASRAMAEAEEARHKAESARREGMLQAAAQLEGIVGNITSSSSELSDLVGQASRGTEVQRERTSETAAAMEQMNAAVLEVAENAGRAAEVSETTGKKAQEGASVVGEAVAAIGKVSDLAQALKEQMLSLGAQTDSIGHIMGVISDIADQTNLLALNAAIEAARAGEAGRGFAVVADEVRKLAEKTMAATRDVGQAIETIQGATKENVQATENAALAVQSATDLAGDSGRVLQEIVSLADSSTGRVQEIATAAEEQSVSSEHVNQAIEEIRNISEETAQGMARSNQAVAGMTGQARELQNLIRELQAV